MKVNCLLLVSLLVGCLHYGASQNLPFFKSVCEHTPLYRGRADAIIYPGTTSNHVHKIAGGNNWFCEGSDSPVQCYNRTMNSTCTTCQISADKSAYWVPDLFYRWPNNTISLVPDSRMTVYFMGKAGTGNQSQPDLKPFPPGFQVISGYPFRRSYNSSLFTNTAVSWMCLGDTPSPATPGFPTGLQKCTHGLRAQVIFPQCWDGVHLTSPEGSLHRHVAFPIESMEEGNCPADHPIRLPMLYFEVVWNVTQFPHGNGVQPFILSAGDSTGYGIHGAFLNGWDVNVLQAALKDPSCLASNTNNGSNSLACKTLASYMKSPLLDQTCLIARPIANFEDLGINHVISHLPGCQPITGPGPSGPVCNGTWPQNTTSFSPTLRVLLRSKKTGLYVSATTPTLAVSATCAQQYLGYAQVFDLIKNGPVYAIQTEVNTNFISTHKNSVGPLLPFLKNPTFSDMYYFTYYNSTGPTLAGSEASILNVGTKKFVAVQDDGALWPSADSDDNIDTRFYVVDADAGVTDTRSMKF